LQLYRHGDRSPVRAFPTDPYQENFWWFQMSGLCFLNESYIRHEILVRSTDVDRTLMSAEANLAGLYPPEGQQIFQPSLKWQPIPVHTVPENEEKLLSFPLNDCPRYKQLMNETENTAEFINVTTKYRDFIEMVKNKTGLKVATVESVWSVYDTLFCESRHNMSAPHWVTPDVMEKLRFLKDFGFQVLFGIYKQQEKSRLQGGLLLGEIVKNLTKMALFFLVATQHDTTVVALQASLNVFNGKQAPYASCHIIELYREDNGSASVSMFYRNDTSVPPYPVQLPGCAHVCPLEDFVRITKPFISDDRDKECQVPSKGRDRQVIIGLALSGCLLLAVIAVLLGVICRHKESNRNRGYHHVINQEAGEES
uniref:Lysosomal acid phosphatase n=1 Tax=Xiphophorus couchianus TaxID=32473 RepID=A0A3B5MQ35_9TELE